MTVDDEHMLMLDHRRVSGDRLQISELRPHLIELTPKKGKGPEVIIRLNPPKENSSNWSIALDSKPWLQIRLNDQPAGQTPRSKLRIDTGHNRLVLHRDEIHIRLDLEVRKAD